jgi:segregation and condensation protein B
MLELKNIIKALLLSNDGQMLAVDDFNRALPDIDEELIYKTINELKEEGGDTFDVIEVQEHYYARTKLEYTQYIQRLKGVKPDPRTRRALMETLALIAMRQPISRVEIEDARMVQLNVTILHDLQDYGWVKVVKVTSNDTHLYGTTLKFLQDFGLSSISEFEKMSLNIVANNA